MHRKPSPPAPRPRLWQPSAPSARAPPARAPCGAWRAYRVRRSAFVSDNTSCRPFYSFQAIICRRLPTMTRPRAFLRYLCLTAHSLPKSDGEFVMHPLKVCQGNVRLAEPPRHRHHHALRHRYAVKVERQHTQTGRAPPSPPPARIRHHYHLALRHRRADRPRHVRRQADRSQQGTPSRRPSRSAPVHRHAVKVEHRHAVRQSRARHPPSSPPRDRPRRARRHALRRFVGTP